MPAALLYVVLLFAAAAGARAEDLPKTPDLAADALARVQQKDYDGATERFRELAKREPGNYHWRNWIARLRSWRNDFRGAESEYRLILAENGTDREAALGLADVTAWQKRYAEAIRQLDELDVRNPDNVEVLVRLGRIHRWNRQPDVAKEYLHRVLKLDPANAEGAAELRAILSEPPALRGSLTSVESPDAAGRDPQRFVSGTLSWAARRNLTIGAGYRADGASLRERRTETLRSNWRATENTSVAVELLRSKGEELLPTSSASAEVMQRLAPGLYAGLGKLRVTTPSVVTSVDSLILDFTSESRWNVHARFTPTVTEGAGAGSRTSGGWMRLTLPQHEGLTSYLVGGYGVRTLDDASAERAPAATQLLLGAGGAVLIGTDHRLDFALTRQVRRHGGDSWSATFQYRVAF